MSIEVKVINNRLIVETDEFKTVINETKTDNKVFVYECLKDVFNELKTLNKADVKLTSEIKSFNVLKEQVSIINYAANRIEIGAMILISVYSLIQILL